MYLSPRETRGGGHGGGGGGDGLQIRPYQACAHTNLPLTPVFLAVDLVAGGSAYLSSTAAANTDAWVVLVYSIYVKTMINNSFPSTGWVGFQKVI